MQFAMEDTGWAGSILEAYERLILEAVKGNQTLFTSAEGVERLWEISPPLLEHMPPVRAYPQGSWGPNQIQQLIAPPAWRLPFARKWRDRRWRPTARSGSLMPPSDVGLPRPRGGS